MKLAFQYLSSLHDFYNAIMSCPVSLGLISYMLNIW